MKENKTEICHSFLECLQKTSFFQDLQSLEYTKNDTDPDFPNYNGLETVTATFKNKHKKKINVEMDSGAAMIKDILKGLS